MMTEERLAEIKRLIEMGLAFRPLYLAELWADVEFLRRERADMLQIMRDGFDNDSPEAVRLAVVEAREVLEKMEWEGVGVDRHGDSQAECPLCDEPEMGRVHAPDCKLAKLLGRPTRAD